MSPSKISNISPDSVVNSVTTRTKTTQYPNKTSPKKTIHIHKWLRASFRVFIKASAREDGFFQLSPIRCRGGGTWQRGIPRHRCRFGQGVRRPTLTVQGWHRRQSEQNSNLRPCPILQASWCRSRISSHLKVLWAECGSSPPAASFPTVEFYGHRPASGALRCFSNFYEHPRFDSVVRRRGGGRRRTATSCAGHVHRKGHHAVQG